jgi:integrase
VRKAHTLLGSILRAAVASGRLAANPQRHVRRLPAGPRAEVRPLAPVTVERLRAAIGADPKGRADLRWLRERDRLLVALLAYSGIRPQEARALRWSDVRDATLAIYAPKTRTARTVRLLAPLKADLAAWRLYRGRGDEFVIPGADGGEWTANAYANWRGRTWAGYLDAAGLEPCKPYALRHSFASLLAHEGRSVVYIARQLGHSAEESLRTYQHVIDELEDRPRLAAEDAIRAARRGDDVRTQFGRGE